MKQLARTALLFLVLPAALGLPGCATTTETQPWSVDLGDELVEIAISSEAGMPVEDFIRLGQRVTGKVFTYSRKDLARTKQGIKMVGTAKLPRRSFYRFFETMLRVNGYECVPQGEAVEIRPARKSS